MSRLQERILIVAIFFWLCVTCANQLLELLINLGIGRGPK